jgi:3-hydroxyacyl-[acyl-carrier-protein] dehydratase
MMHIKDIQKLLPHRYPFLMVDRVIEIDLGKRIAGIKNLSINEEFFQGHFPGNPIMPGVLIVEALAQVAAILALKSGAPEGQPIYFMSIEKAKFRRPVVPGDQLRLEVSILQSRGNVWKFSGNAVVKDKVVAQAEFTAMVTDREI